MLAAGAGPAIVRVSTLGCWRSPTYTITASDLAQCGWDECTKAIERAEAQPNFFVDFRDFAV